eukprot:8985070-Ditylum_brightwellii.AAC.1
MLWRNLTTAALTPAIFQGEFPLTAKFRGGPRNEAKSCEYWEKITPRPHGHVPDLQTNVIRFSESNWICINQYVEKNPGLTYVSTWRAASGFPKDT